MYICLGEKENKNQIILLPMQVVSETEYTGNRLALIRIGKQELKGYIKRNKVYNVEKEEDIDCLPKYIDYVGELGELASSYYLERPCPRYVEMTGFHQIIEVRVTGDLVFGHKVTKEVYKNLRKKNKVIALKDSYIDGSYIAKETTGGYHRHKVYFKDRGEVILDTEEYLICLEAGKIKK